MIGQAVWFARRKYGGWGLMPKTWQGWVYIAVMAGVTFLFLNAPFIPEPIRFPVTYAWLGLTIADMLHIMATLKKDEMEVKIEALAERNASWTMVFIIAIGVAYQAAQSAVTGQSQLDWFLIATAIGGVIAKAVTNLWLERRGV